jgi:hypothetical protein
MAPKRRALVLENEAVRHPFRRTLPPRVLVPMKDEPMQRRRWFSFARFTPTGVREFLMAYCAMFAAVSTFIA